MVNLSKYKFYTYFITMDLSKSQSLEKRDVIMVFVKISNGGNK